MTATVVLRRIICPAIRSSRKTCRSDNKRHCEERSDEAIQSGLGSKAGLLRFARNDELELQLPLPLTECAQPQRIELDEARRVALIVGHRAFLEGHEILVVERIGTFAADDAGIAFVEFELDRAGDKFLALVDRRLQ